MGDILRVGRLSKREITTQIYVAYRSNNTLLDRRIKEYDTDSSISTKYPFFSDFLAKVCAAEAQAIIDATPEDG